MGLMTQQDLITEFRTCVFTVFRVSGGSDDGHGHHHQARGAPHVLHQELLQHDVPEALQQDLMDLR